MQKDPNKREKPAVQTIHDEGGMQYMLVKTKSTDPIRLEQKSYMEPYWDQLTDEDKVRFTSQLLLSTTLVRKLQHQYNPIVAHIRSACLVMQIAINAVAAAQWIMQSINNATNEPITH